MAEEETELFPLARRAPIDLYALGRAVAAQRVEKITELRPRGAGAVSRKSTKTKSTKTKRTKTRSSKR